MIAFPLLLIPLAVYNIIVFMMPGLSLTEPLTSVTLSSGAIWNVTSGDVLLVMALLLLLFEMAKAARPDGKSIVEFLLAIMLSAGAIAEFVLLPAFANSVFFLLTVMTVVDLGGSLIVNAQSRRWRHMAAVPIQAPASPVPASSEAQRTEPLIDDAPAEPPPPPHEDETAGEAVRSTTQNHP